jgi:hypothetical protein
MAQVFLMLKGDYVETTQLPDPCEQVLPGIRWGRFEHFFTPAFWYTQVLSAEQRGFPEKPRLGHTLSEEVAACLLGGYGMRAELGLAAFRRLKEHWLGSDCVAVIDVHVRRAGLLLGLFREDMQPSRHYFDMEEAFLEFATAIRVRASILDAVMWSHMRRMRHVALRAAAAGSPN